MKRPRGRPPKPEDEVLSERIEIRTTADEKAQFEAAAESANMPLSQWIRHRLQASSECELAKEKGLR